MSNLRGQPFAPDWLEWAAVHETLSGIAIHTFSEACTTREQFELMRKITPYSWGALCKLADENDIRMFMLFVAEATKKEE